MKGTFTQHQEIFNLLFEAVSEGIIVVNNQQHVIAVNKAAEQMFGYEKGELDNKPLDLLIPKNYRKHHHEHVSKFVTESQKRQMGHGRDLYGLKKDGSQFAVEAGLNPFQVDGESYVMALVIDISIRKAAQQEIKKLNAELEEKIKIRTSELQNTVTNLEEEVLKRKEAEKKIKNALQKEKELNELKTKFLSLVSHEFKTPLSGILTSVSLIEKYKLEEQQEKREKHTATIRNKVHYLNNILNDFLSIERLDSGKGQYKYSHFKLNRLVNEVIYNANVTLKNGQEIHYPQDRDDVEFYQDEKILELILSNLMNNAIKYSPADSSISFDYEIKDNFITFTVRDEGMGIPKKDQKHIFERYFRAENALLNQGTGIGLNIAKSHLDHLGGSISFKSEENKGTEFKVVVPIIMK